MEMCDFLSIAIPQLVVAVLFFLGAMLLLKRPGRFMFLLSLPHWITKWVWGLAILFAGLYVFDELSLLFLETGVEPGWFQPIDAVLDWSPVFWLTFSGSLILLVEFAVSQTSNFRFYKENPEERLRFILAILSLYGLMFNIAIFFWSGFLQLEFGRAGLSICAMLFFLTMACYAVPFFKSKTDAPKTLTQAERLEFGATIKRIGLVSGFLVLTESIISRVIFTITVINLFLSRSKKVEKLDASVLSREEGECWVTAFSFHFLMLLLLPMLFFWLFMVRPFPPDASYLKHPFIVSILFQFSLTFHVLVHILRPARKVWYVVAVFLGVMVFYVGPFISPETYALEINPGTFLFANLMRVILPFIHIGFALSGSMNSVIRNIRKKEGVAVKKYARAFLADYFVATLPILGMAPLAVLGIYQAGFLHYSQLQWSILSAACALFFIIAAELSFFRDIEKQIFQKLLDELEVFGGMELVKKVADETPILLRTKPFSASFGNEPVWWRFVIFYPVALAAIPVVLLLESLH